MAENIIEVSVIIPLYNEKKHVGKCIESILSQDYDKTKLEILFVDGGSTDGTAREILDYVSEYPFMNLLYNPNKTVPYAMNKGIYAAKGDYIIRFDGHSEYAENYISKCVEYLKKTGADNVGGHIVAEGKTRIQKIIAAAYCSPFALGGAKFHNQRYEGYADTVYLGAFRKEALFKAGLYDEKFVRNQDDELNYRIISSGGKIYITSEIKSVYYPRDSISKLFSQYFQYGLWKVAIIRKHGKTSRLRHLAPMLFVLFNIAGILFLSVWKIRIIYVGIMAIYILLAVYFSFINRKIYKFSDKFILTYIHFVLHISYGLGFIYGILRAI